MSGEESCADSGGNSLTRIRVPRTGGVSTSPATGGSTLKRSMVAGAPLVFQTSKKRGPFGPIGRCSGGLVSLATMATPLSLWPVTMRRKDFDILPILRYSVMLGNPATDHDRRIPSDAYFFSSRRRHTRFWLSTVR